MWTASLTLTGIAGLWLIPRHWWGWAFYLLNEVLWLCYGLSIHSTPVIVMSLIWGAMGVRNLLLARSLSHAEGS
jgi:hypothetical protein